MASTSGSPKPRSSSIAIEPRQHRGGHLLAEAHQLGVGRLHLLPGADHAAVALVGGEPLLAATPAARGSGASSGKRVEELDHPGARLLGQHPEEVVLVLEVPVEAAVATPRRPSTMSSTRASW